MKLLDYQDMKNKIILLIREQSTMVIATCSNNRVTARTVHTASDGLKIYFITSTAYLKYKQILQNSNVALCFNNVQIEGVASLLGHPLLPENVERLKSCSPANGEFMSYTKYKNAVLTEVAVSFVGLWENGGREYIDFNKDESYRIG